MVRKAKRVKMALFPMIPASRQARRANQVVMEAEVSGELSHDIEKKLILRFSNLHLLKLKKVAKGA